MQLLRIPQFLRISATTLQKIRWSKYVHSLARTCGALGIVLMVVNATTNGQAQTAESLSQVKKIYVNPLGEQKQTTDIRDRLIKKLRESGRFQVVESPAASDAVIQGTSQIWVTGYVSTDARSPANTRTPVFRGFLAIEIVGKGREPLWSYLVTPGKIPRSPITHELADRLVARLLEVAGQKGEASATPAIAEVPGASSLSGAGATFPAPLYRQWITTFQEQRPTSHIVYDPVGSTAGIELLASGHVDFAASDAPLSDEQMAQLSVKFLHFPTVLGAVVPIYNLKGISRPLNFTPDVLAGIYLGRIRKWNDPAIGRSNRGVSLPDTEIVVVHRSDGSGTSFVWTDFLSKVNPEWKATGGASTTPKWPVGTGAEGSEGVSLKVRQTSGSIGYVELVYALQHELSFGAVRNSAGRFVSADIPSVIAAAEGSTGNMNSDFRVSITNSPGKNAYPIATFTWFLVPKDGMDSAKKSTMGQFLKWVLTSGQKQCSSLGYVPLPREVANRELQSLANAFP